MLSKLRHDRAPVRIGRNCPEPEEHGAAQAVRGRRRPHGRQRAGHAQPLTARTAWYVEGNSKAAPHTPLPLRQAARAGPKGRRRQGSMPNGRDSARGAGQRPRARRRYAGTPGISRQDSLHSKYCCFVESATRPRQVGSANCPQHFPKTSSNGGSWFIWCARRAVQRRRKRSSFAAIACSMPASMRCLEPARAGWTGGSRLRSRRAKIETLGLKRFCVIICMKFQ